MSSCSFCTRPATTDGLCSNHFTARRNLHAGFPRWREAYGGMSFKEYLGRLLALSETGAWARNVAEAELETHSEES